MKMLKVNKKVVQVELTLSEFQSLQYIATGTRNVNLNERQEQLIDAIEMEVDKYLSQYHAEDSE